MGRTATGVRGMKLAAGHQVISLIIARADARILTASENGFGKCTPVEDYPSKGRGGMGVISLKTSARNGQAVGAVIVDESDQIMLISDGGILVRTRVSDISVTGRSAQGVKLISLSGDEKLIGIEPVAQLAGEADEAELDEANATDTEQGDSDA